MTDTGQVPGEGQPESAGMAEQPGVPAPGAYAYLSETTAEDEDLLLLPGAQGAWGNEVAPPAPEPVVQVVHEPGPHETSGRDSGSVDVSAVRAPVATPVPQAPVARRPLHLGPPIPNTSASPVRSLADRGPAGAPVPSAPASPVLSVSHSGAPTTGPEYLDVPQPAENVPQGVQTWAAAPGAAPAEGTPAQGTPTGVAVAETVVPEGGQGAESLCANPRPDQPEGPGAFESKAEEGVMAEPSRRTTTPEAEVPGPSGPGAGLHTGSETAVAAGVPQPPEAAVDATVPQGGEAEAAQVAEVAQSVEAAEPVEATQAAPGVTAPGAAEEALAVAEAAQSPELQHAVDGSPAPSASDPTPFPAAPAPEAPQEADTAAPVAEAAPAPAEQFAEPEHVAAVEARQFAPEPQPAQDPQAVVPGQVAMPDHVAMSDQAPEPAETPQPDQPQLAEQGPQLAEQGPQMAPPVEATLDAAVHTPDPAAQFADSAAHAEPPQAEPVAQEAVPAQQPAPLIEAQAPLAEPVVTEPEPAYAVPVGVAAHAEASHGAAGPVPGAPLEPQADQPIGRFVPVEGTVPTTPHLAPTPPHAMTVPPFPTVEQPVEPQPQEPAEAPAAVQAPEAAVPTPPAGAEPTAPAAEETPEPAEAVSAEAPAAEAPSEEATLEEEPSAKVPAPREAEEEASAVAESPAPEPLAADPDPDVVQSVEDLDTRAADQEEGTAVEEAGPSTGPAAPPYDEAEREAVLKVMRERRDIRNGFRGDPIPHEVLLRVLEAAHTAPSVGHSQPWDFVVIRSAETRRTMHELAQRQREAYAKSLPKGRAKQFKELKIEAILDTPVNIVVTADPTRGGRHTLGRHTQPQMAPYSSALAVENLWLAARAEGLGVGWVSFFDEREMVRALGLPEHLEVVAYLCVGYVDEFPEEPELMQAGWAKRRPLSWVVHEETYGRRALPGEDPHDLLGETVANIRPLDAKALGEAWERQKRMTKPPGALGMLEIISAQLSGLSRQCPPPIPEPAAVAIFAGDHGVHAQGVTPWPQEVTAQMVANFLGGGAVCNAFAGQVGAEVCVVDVGVASELPSTPGLLPRKVRAGTADMTTGPALTREEVKQAIEVGIETARDLVAAGNKALLTGEMGIANTTASAALISVFTDSDPAEVTGRGTGINDETLARKTEVVRRAIELHQPDPADPIGVLAAFGGLEHAAMVGLLLGGASLRTPVILDGVSAGAAALVARAIAPEVLAACIAGHRSAEPGHVAALNKLGLRPLVDLDLRLGEGTGALLALPVVQSAARAMHEVATFDSAGVTEK